jgi:hypothetical protein
MFHGPQVLRPARIMIQGKAFLRSLVTYEFIRRKPCDLRGQKSTLPGTRCRSQKEIVIHMKQSAVQSGMENSLTLSCHLYIC